MVWAEPFANNLLGNAGFALATGGERNQGRSLQDSQSFDCNQFWIAGADTDAVELAPGGLGWDGLWKLRVAQEVYDAKCWKGGRGAMVFDLRFTFAGLLGQSCLGLTGDKDSEDKT